MNFKLEDLGGHAFRKTGTDAEADGWKGPEYGGGWYFMSERGLSKGETFGPWATSESALQWGPCHAACAGVELATAIA